MSLRNPLLAKPNLGHLALMARFYQERTEAREYDVGHSRSEAERLAWGETQLRWHAERGKKAPPGICAGCQRDLKDIEPSIELGDGTRVHLRHDHGCLIKHGQRWRSAADRALIAIGLEKPHGFTND